MNLLDKMLESATVTSEQHDTSKVNVEGAAIDQALGRPSDGGGWDAAEYGISREEAIRRFEAANTPAAREKVLTDLRRRALQRAGLDTSNDRVAVMSAGQLPWHGLGVVVDKATTSAEAIRFANLDWKVLKLPLSYEFQGASKTADGAYSIVREDTGRCLGTVGGRYAPIQNSQGFDFLDSVLSEFGARYETAGSLYGGSRVWMLTHLPKQRFNIQQGDTIEPYVLFSNCHDGSGAAACHPAAVRVVCANTFRTAGRDRSKGISIRHTGNVRDKVRQAQKALGLAVRSFDEFRETAEEMIQAPIAIKNYADDVLDCVLDVTAADCLKGADLLAKTLAVTEANQELVRKQIVKKIERRGEILNDILTRHESERCKPHGTLWGAWNAVTEYADHNTIGKRSRDQETRLSRHFESVIEGEADQLKQAAYTTAVNAMTN